MSYTVVRVHRDTDSREIIAAGITLEEARAHCSDPLTAGTDWMDVCYEEEP